MKSLPAMWQLFASRCAFTSVLKTPEPDGGFSLEGADSAVVQDDQLQGQRIGRAVFKKRKPSNALTIWRNDGLFGSNMLHALGAG